MNFSRGLTAASSVPDFHRIPFSSYQASCPIETITAAKVHIFSIRQAWTSLFHLTKTPDKIFEIHDFFSLFLDLLHIMAASPYFNPKESVFNTKISFLTSLLKKQEAYTKKLGSLRSKAAQLIGRRYPSYCSIRQTA